MTGTLSEEQFSSQCKTLVELSDKLGDGWELRYDQQDTYIVKKCKVSATFRDAINQHSSSTPTTEEPSSSIGSDSEEEDLVSLAEEDPSSLPILSASLLTFEYHVIYSPAYQVPVLYFNAWHSTGALLTPDEVWRFAPSRPAGDAYNYITQADHPVLGGPFYQVHPCRTEVLMGEVLGRQDKYLIAWLSFLGRDVGLSLGNEYGML